MVEFYGEDDIDAAFEGLSAVDVFIDGASDPVGAYLDLPDEPVLQDSSGGSFKGQKILLLFKTNAIVGINYSAELNVVRQGGAAVDGVIYKPREILAVDDGAITSVKCLKV